MNGLQVFKFDDTELSFITYKGRRAVLASELGEALGYSDTNGSQLIRMMNRDWKDDFEEGIDFDLIAGDELRDLRDVFARADFARANQDDELVDPRYGSTNPIPSMARSVAILYESGINLACIRTRKPIGRRLRRWLAREVLPQIAKNGFYLPSSLLDDAKAALEVAKVAEKSTDRILKKQNRILRNIEENPQLHKTLPIAADEPIPTVYPDGSPVDYKRRFKEALKRMRDEVESLGYVDLDRLMTELGESVDDWLSDSMRVHWSKVCRDYGLIAAFRGEAHPWTNSGLKRWLEEKDQKEHPENWPCAIDELTRKWVGHHPGVWTVDLAQVAEDIGIPAADTWHLNRIKKQLKKYAVRGMPPKRQKKMPTAEEMREYLSKKMQWRSEDVARRFRLTIREAVPIMRDAGYIETRRWDEKEQKRRRVWIKGD